MKKSTILTLIVFAAVYIFLLSYFKPSLLFSQTITAGGDTASHYPTAAMMRDELLPNLKISGWTQGNYAGTPLFQFYFPLAFILMALLSFIIPLQIAFKLVTLLGTFLLPLTAYTSFRLMKFKHPTPLLAALFTLPFIFMEANSMWGGNIPSTLAGEFSHSLSLALAILFLGCLYQGITEKKHIIRNAILLAAIGLTHVYTLFIVVMSSAILLTQNFKQHFKYLFKTYLLAFLLLAFWILPFIAGLAYTTPYNIPWDIKSFTEVFPKTLLPFLIIASITFLYLLYKKQLKHRELYLFFPLIISTFFFFIANNLNLIDIRFLSFIQYYITFAAAFGIFLLLEKIKKFQAAIILLITIAVLAMVAVSITFIPGWIRWNYSGFEGKPDYSQFQEINTALSGSLQQPRVMFEHSSIHNKFGTTRAFESLPYFAHRQTLEGLYMQASPSSPFIFYLQSELSKEQSCPFWNLYPCTHMNITKGTEHLKLFNVQHILAVSPEAKAALSKHPEYSLLKNISEYSIYELTTNENAYVTLAKYQPLYFKTENWKPVSYNWFRYANTSIPLVFNREASSYKITSLDQMKAIPIPSNCSLQETIEQEKIIINTSCINQPLIIKISYHPGWKVKQGAEKIFLISPSFMLLYPQQETVILQYESTPAKKLGTTLTILGILFILVVWWFRPKVFFASRGYKKSR